MLYPRRSTGGPLEQQELLRLIGRLEHGDRSCVLQRPEINDVTGEIGTRPTDDTGAAAREAKHRETMRVRVIDPIVTEGVAIQRQVKNVREDVGNATAATEPVPKPLANHHVRARNTPCEERRWVPFLQKGRRDLLARKIEPTAPGIRHNLSLDRGRRQSSATRTEARRYGHA
jgi:hypothetical protein